MGDHGKQVSWLTALESLHRLPGLPKVQWPIDAGRTVHSCGGSPGIEPEFPFNPVGELVAWGDKVPQKHPVVNRALFGCVRRVDRTRIHEQTYGAFKRGLS